MHNPTSILVGALVTLMAHAAAAAPASTAAAQTPSREGGRPGSTADVVALSFGEIYKRPVGPHGLELSAKVVALDGKRVRIAGYMVAEEAPIDGRFLLAPRPVSLSDAEDGPADDLPPAVVYVKLAGRDKSARVHYQREALQLTGILRIGNQVEPDLRVSLLRLELEPASALSAREADR